jgi:hypothetical protein
MTKIEEFKQAKHVAGKIARDVAYTLGRDSPRNDKATFSVSYAGLSRAQWTPMQFHIECAYGYYGCSSGYNATSDELGKYLAAAIQKHGPTLLDCAAQMAADDAEKARKAAEDEARSVLTETAA